MGIAKDVIASKEDYQSILAAHHTVFMLFVSEKCPACKIAVQIFEPIAKAYEASVKSLVLDTLTTFKVEGVTVTPTLVIYVNGKSIEHFEGFGPWDSQEQTVNKIFSCYAQAPAPGKLESHAAPLPPRPSTANPHAPGYRPPPADGRADSSPGRPGSGNPR